MIDSWNKGTGTPAGKRYIVEIGVAMAVYIAVLLVSLHVLETAKLSPLLRDLVAVTPAIPVIAAVAAVIRFVQSIDELQRQIHIEAFAISAGLTAALSITYGFLENIGFPCVNAWWTFVAVDVFWAFSLPFIRRRYE